MRKKITTALMALTALLAAVPAWAQTSGDRSDYLHDGWGWGWGHMISGGLMMVLFWGGIILVIVFAVRALGGGSSGGSSQTTPPSTPSGRALDILQERFARGEIEKAEFEERKRSLTD